MSSYKHKSGAHKMSEKEQRDQEAKKISRTIFQDEVKKATEEGRQKERTEDAHRSHQCDPEVQALDARSDLEAEVDTEGNVAPNDATKLSTFDIGTSCGSPTTNQLENIIRAGPSPFPKQFPRDAAGHPFPDFCSTLQLRKWGKNR